MVCAYVFQQSFNITFGVRKIKSIVRQILKEKWEEGFKRLYLQV